MSPTLSLPFREARIERNERMTPAEQLFDRLLREGRLISYIDAYETLLGKRPQRWWNRMHCRQVTTVALQTEARQFEGLTLHLDALIVSRETGEPGEGHFGDKPYTRGQWRQVFGHWSVLYDKIDP